MDNAARAMLCLLRVIGRRGMAARPGGKGPTLYEVAGWLQGAVGAPFRAAGWAEDEIPLHEMEQRWAEWRTRRGF